MNIILAGTGSVAAIKYWRLFKDLQDIGTVKGILTDKGAYFASTALSENKDLLNIASSVSVYDDSHEWSWEKIGDQVLHIDLKDWADVLVIAPLSANTLTKMAVGICDNLLTSLYYAWPNNKPIIVAPAMNTDMWKNPLTDKHLSELKARHYKRFQLKTESNTSLFPETLFNVIEPVESKLACGVLGKGAMAPLADIVNAVKEYGE
jgi:phosphopantothenoylcysteine decarboxylase